MTALEGTSFDTACAGAFAAVHDQKDPLGLMKGLRASLRPGGVYLMQDSGASADSRRTATFPSRRCSTRSRRCTARISIGQGGEGPGSMWGWETAERFLRDAGFATDERHVLPHDRMNMWFVARV